MTILRGAMAPVLPAIHPSRSCPGGFYDMAGTLDGPRTCPSAGRFFFYGAGLRPRAVEKAAVLRPLRRRRGRPFYGT